MELLVLRWGLGLGDTLWCHVWEWISLSFISADLSLLQKESQQAYHSSLKLKVDDPEEEVQGLWHPNQRPEKQTDGTSRFFFHETRLRHEDFSDR